MNKLSRIAIFSLIFSIVLISPLTLFASDGSEIFIEASIPPWVILIPDLGPIISTRDGCQAYENNPNQCVDPGAKCYFRYDALYVYSGTCVQPQDGNCYCAGYFIGIPGRSDTNLRRSQN